jgi:hypothetical protein
MSKCGGRRANLKSASTRQGGGRFEIKEQANLRCGKRFLEVK